GKRPRFRGLPRIRARSIRAGTDEAGRSPVSSPGFFERGSRVTASQLAFVFPGQGSQSAGMLADLAARGSLVRDTFAEASEGAGVDLWAIAQAEGDPRLTRPSSPSR